jgi:hypothetical protein
MGRGREPNDGAVRKTPGFEKDERGRHDTHPLKSHHTYEIDLTTIEEASLVQPSRTNLQGSPLIETTSTWYKRRPVYLVADGLEELDRRPANYWRNIF